MDQQRVLAAAIVGGLLAGASGAQEISRLIPKGVALDSLYRIPHQTVLRGHAETWDGIADLLENLGQDPRAAEPVLRQITCSERGFEYVVAVPESEPAPEPAPEAERPRVEPPFFAARPVARGLFRLLRPPFT